MKNKVLIFIGLFFQTYYIISFIYSLLASDKFEKQQQIYIKFWFFFSDPYHSVVFMAIITAILISLIIRNLATTSESILIKIFLIVEFLFLLYLGWGLL